MTATYPQAEVDPAYTAGGATDVELAALAGTRWPVFTPEAYGAVGDLAADDTDALNAAIQAAYDAGGGDVFCAESYLIEGDVAFPHNGDAVPKQARIRLTGNGGWASGQGGVPEAILSRGVLELRGTGGPAKLDTRGLGLLEVDHLTIRDEGDTGHPFLQTTNTTVRIHDNAFVGDSGRSVAACDQDAIVLGGTDTTADATDDAPFQGYGSVIANNYFNHIRRAVFGRTYANAVVVRDNFVGHQCGSNLADGAAIEFLGVPSSSCAGNTIASNGIEMSGYPYGVKFTYASTNNLYSNGYFDPHPTNTLAYVRFDTAAEFNTILAGFGSDTKPTMSEAVSGKNTLITSHQTQPSQFPQGVIVNDLLRALAGVKQVIVQPGTTSAGTDKVLRVLRSAAEASNPGLALLEMVYGGTLTIAGGNTQKLSLRDGSGTEIAELANFGKKWAAIGSGANMEQNSGSGGSYLDLKNFGVRFYNHSGVLQVVVGDGGETVKFGASKDAQIERKAAKVIGLPTDHVFMHGKGATGSRPNPSTVGAGSEWYDTTLGKPIWSDGAAWDVGVLDDDARLTDQRVPTDGSVTAAKVNTTLKPSGSAASTDESLRRLGTGSTHAAAGDDARFPTTGQKNALAGTSGTPGSGNEYVTLQGLNARPTHTGGLLTNRPAAGSVPTWSTYYATDDNGGTLYVTDGSNWKRPASGQEIDYDERTSDCAAGSATADVDGVPTITVPAGDRPWELLIGCHSCTGVTAGEEAQLLATLTDNTVALRAYGMVQVNAGNTGSFHGRRRMAALGATTDYKLRRATTFGTSITPRAAATSPIYIAARWL